MDSCGEIFFVPGDKCGAIFRRRILRCHPYSEPWPRTTASWTARVICISFDRTERFRSGIRKKGTVPKEQIMVCRINQDFEPINVPEWVIKRNGHTPNGLRQAAKQPGGQVVLPPHRIAGVPISGSRTHGGAHELVAFRSPLTSFAHTPRRPGLLLVQKFRRLPIPHA